MLRKPLRTEPEKTRPLRPSVAMNRFRPTPYCGRGEGGEGGGGGGRG